jgi:hypothetical protein
MGIFLCAQSYKPLSKEAITKHLEDFGMDPEITNHNAILGLSGAPRAPILRLLSAISLPLYWPGSWPLIAPYACPLGCMHVDPALLMHA